jgi:hypothetical protein
MKLYIILLSVLVIIIAIVAIFFAFQGKPKVQQQQQQQQQQPGVYSEWKDVPGSRCVYCDDTVNQTRECSEAKCEGPSTQTRQCNANCKRYIQQYGLRCNVHDSTGVFGVPCRYTNGSFTSNPNPSHVYVWNSENKLYYQQGTKKCINKENELTECKLDDPDLQWEVKNQDISPINSDFSSRITEIPT